MKPITQKFEFQNRHGAKLAGRLDLPLKQSPRAFAIFAHCFSCSKDLVASRNISAALAAKGIGVLRFDFTGLGNSQGEFANSHFRANVDDLSDAITAMNDASMPPSLLIGHSLGGAAALQATALSDQIKAVAVVGAPYDPAHAAERMQGDIEAIKTQGHGTVHLAGRPFDITAEFLESMKPEHLDDRLKSLGAALIVLHSPIDDTVGIDNATNIFVKAKHPKSFVGLDGADHLLTKPEDAEFVGSTIANWSTRYLPEASNQPQPAEGEVMVTETGNGKFQQQIQVGNHNLIADEPASFGGLESGPAPYDFLLAGLGACTSMTIRMVAARKEIPLDRVSVALEHKKIHAQDCADCETTSGKVDLIERKVWLEGDDLTAEQRDYLIEIADKCPVHRTLHSEVKVTTDLAS